MKDNFSTQSEGYAKYRPQYPAELFAFINDHVKNKNLAWDCATGNGQSAKELSTYFSKVHATDISQNQLDNAVKKENITYAKEPAEQTSLKDASVDLTTVSQALHWFNFDKFYAEVKRVSAPDAMIAVWLYHLISINPEIDAVVRSYHFETLMKYYDAERVHVDDGYANIPFPFKEIECPLFTIKLNWSIEDFEGYFNTSSAVQKYIKQHNESPLPDFIKNIKRLWPDGQLLPVQLPVQLKMGYVH